MIPSDRRLLPPLRSEGHAELGRYVEESGATAEELVERVVRDWLPKQGRHPR